jgi:hypothetical protein
MDTDGIRNLTKVAQVCDRMRKVLFTSLSSGNSSLASTAYPDTAADISDLNDLAS